MKLAEWADKQGIARITAYRWFHAGKLPVKASRVGGLILVEEESPNEVASRTVIYARVSSADQKSDLDRQVSRVTRWATTQGLTISGVVTEVGSALNGHRPKFVKLLNDPTVGTIVVEHRDRCARFGFDYVQATLEAHGRTIIVVDPAEVDDDLVRDVTEILTSVCARLYGKRAAHNRAKAALAAAAGPTPDDD